MDKRFGRKGMLWIALGLVALLFLCLVVACLGAATVFAPRQGGVWMQPPAGEQGAVPPAQFYPLHGTWGPLGVVGAGLHLLLKLFLFGLLVLLVVRLVGWLFWGRWRACPPHGYGPWKGAPQGAPGDEAGEPGSAWRRHPWHHHHRHWGPPPWWAPRPPAAPEAEAGEEEPDAGYTGPME